jgi:protein TonB
MSLITADILPEKTQLALPRWFAAAVIVVLFHALAAFFLLRAVKEDAPPGEPPAIMLDLAPAPVAPPAENLDVAPGPKETEAAPPEEIMPEKPVVETPEQMIVEPTPPEIKLPDPPPQEQKSEVVLAPPPKPAPPQKKIEKPVPRKDVEKKDKPQQRTTAPQRVEAARADTMAAPSPGSSGAPSQSSAAWKALISAHLNRYKRYPEGAAGATGTAMLAFVLNRSGQVISARLAGSSGSAALDQEVVAMAHRASPFPAPPAGEGSLSFTVPVRFSGR